MSSAAKKLDWDIAQITEELKSFPLLDGFPENLIMQLAQASQIRQVPQGAEILGQGQLNDQLFFLSSGQVGVYVDGSRVSKMQHKGDLLGEMSVITNKPAGATISAENNVTLVCVDSRVFSTATAKQGGPFQASRSCSRRKDSAPFGPGAPSAALSACRRKMAAYPSAFRRV